MKKFLIILILCSTCLCVGQNQNNLILWLTDNLTLRDNLDHTKRFRFEASGITTGTTRIYACPDANGTLALIEGGPFTEASVPFANSSGVLIEDNSNLFWNDANNTLHADTFSDGTFTVTGGVITGATGNVSLWTNDSQYLEDTVVAALANNNLLLYNSATSKWNNAVSGTIAALMDHGLFLGLGDDDHTQYLLADGTRDMQPSADSTTMWQILDQDGGTPILNIDSTNERVGIGTATPAAVFDVVGNSRFGYSTANYGTFADDGELLLFGTARVLRSVDFEPEAVKQGGVGPGSSTEDGFPIHDYSAASDESVFIHWEIPHEYADGGEIHLHAEYFVDTAPVGDVNVTWGIEYKKLSIGDNFSFSSGTTTIIVNDLLTTGTPVNDKSIHSSPEIHLVTTGFVPMDVVLIRFFRDANASEVGATDAFGSDARLFNYHLMFLSDKMGQGT